MDHTPSTTYKNAFGRTFTITPEDMDKGPLSIGLDLINEHPEDCHVCGQHANDYADTAIHLVDVHHWDTEYARLWLRDKVEAAESL